MFANDILFQKNHPFSRERMLHILNEDRTETFRQCLSICQFKIEQECAREKKSKILFPSAKQREIWKGWNSGSEKAARSARRARELDQSGPWVSGRGALLIPEDLPWSFCVRDLNSGWRCGWRERAVVWFISNRFSRNRDNSPALNFYFSPRSPCPTPRPPFTIVTPAPFCFFIVIASTRVPLEWLRYSMLLHTSDLDPIDRHELIVPQILCPLPRLPLITNCNDVWTSR